MRLVRPSGTPPENGNGAHPGGGDEGRVVGDFFVFGIGDCFARRVRFMHFIQLYTYILIYDLFLHKYICMYKYTYSLQLAHMI